MDKSEIDSRIIELQTIESRFSDDEIAASVNYARSCQRLLRALESKTYKLMEVSAAVQWDETTRNLYHSSFYSDYAKKTYDEAVANFEKKSNEYDASVDVLAQTMKDMEVARDELGHYLSDKFLLDREVLSSLATNNKKFRNQ